MGEGGGGGGGLQDAAELQREVLEELQPYLQAGGEKSSAEDGSAQTQPGDVSQLTSAAPKTAGKSGEGLFVRQTPHGVAALARRFRDSEKLCCRYRRRQHQWQPADCEKPAFHLPLICSAE